jgi:lysozyme
MTNKQKTLIATSMAISIFIGISILLFILLRKKPINPNLADMKTSKLGIDLLKHFEGEHDGDKTKAGWQPKMDPIGIWTIGWGRALINKHTGKFLKHLEDKPTMEKQYPELMNITEAQADNLLLQDIAKFEDIVKRNITTSLSQHQFDALVCYVYNTGGSNTLYSLINSKASNAEIQNWWTTRYITGNGIQLPGLIRRRKAEYHLFSTGTLKFTF